MEPETSGSIYYLGGSGQEACSNSLCLLLRVFTRIELAWFIQMLYTDYVMPEKA